MKLCDAHCHLQDSRLVSSFNMVLQKADDAGVKLFINCGTDPGDWEQVLSLSRQNPSIIPGFGLHPWYLHNAGKDWVSMLDTYLGKTDSFVGEIGLDHALAERNDAAQEEAFIHQLGLAKKHKVPVAIHCRKAWDRLLHLLSRHWPPELPGIIHSYSGTEALVYQLVDMGLYFSFSASVTRSGNRRAHKAVQAVPMDRLLIETDSPDIPPVVNHKIDYETPNEPANIMYVLRTIAELKHLPEEEIAAVTWDNSNRVFSSVLNRKPL